MFMRGCGMLKKQKIKAYLLAPHHAEDMIPKSEETFLLSRTLHDGEYYSTLVSLLLAFVHTLMIVVHVS